jgi:TIR domain/WD domain, G-beta repeat
LLAGLEVAGFAPFLDRYDIVAGENWEKRLGGLIEQSDTVVFVISPEAVKSDHCVWEVNRTIELSKRLLPVIFKPVPTKEIPEQLSSLQFVSFDSARGVTRPLAELADALRQDLAWIREHTRLGALSQRWETRKKAVALLLRGDELEDAERWLERKPPSAPEPTELLRAFLTESRRAELARLDMERQQIEEMAAAQAARQEALKKAEDAQAGIAAEQTRTATAQARTARLLRIARWATAGIFGLAIIAGGIVSYLLAERARELARKELDLKHAQANFLGLLSETKLLRKEIDSALRLASHGTRIDLALPADNTRASLAAAVLAVAVSQANWHFALGGHDGPVYSAAFSPDGTRIVTASGDNTARIWDAASRKEIAVLRGHNVRVKSAAFSPDGTRIVTASGDNTARIWDAHLQTMPPKDLLAQSCARLAVTKLTREEKRLAGFSDDTSEIDVCTSGQ